METKTGDFVSVRDIIINESIKSLQTQGLRFSVDLLAAKLKISKKPSINIFRIKRRLRSRCMKNIIGARLNVRLC